MFGYIKIAMLVIMLGGLAGGVAYVMKLRADLAVSEANNAKLESAVSDQKAVIEQQSKDVEAIRSAMTEQNALNEKLNASIKDLSDKFNKVNASGEKRDIGKYGLDLNFAEVTFIENQYIYSDPDGIVLSATKLF